MSKFLVTVEQTVTLHAGITVEADSQEEATGLVLAYLENYGSEWYEESYREDAEVVDIVEVSDGYESDISREDV